MKHHLRARMLVALSATLLSLPACSDEAPPRSAGPTATTPQATEEPPPSPSPPTAPSYRPDTFSDYFTDTFEPSGGSAETWDVVALGDSTTAGATLASPGNAYPGIYAGMLAEEQGVTVALHSYFPGGTVAEWNGRLSEDEGVRAALAEAEVVLVWIGFHDLLPAHEQCPSPGDWPEYGRCVSRFTRTMPDDYEVLFGAIESLVPDGSTTLAGNFAMPPWIVEDWAGDPLYPRIQRVVHEEWIEAMAEAAVNHGARVVDTYHELAGPSGDQLNPAFVAGDGLHLSAEGQSFIAEVHRDQDGLEPPSSTDPDTTYAETFEPSGAGATETWNVVALGDSTVSGGAIREDEDFSPGEAYPAIYAASLADEQGVTVELTSYFPGQHANEVRTVAEWNEVLAEDGAIRASLAEADIVMTWIGFHDLLPATVFGDCPSVWPDYRDCVRRLTATMAADFEEMFTTIEDLVPPGATVLAGNYAMPPWIIEKWADGPHWPEIRKVVLEEWTGWMGEAAMAHGGRVVDTYHAIGGPDGSRTHEDFSAIDGLHLSATAQRFIARIHLEQDGIEPPG